MLIQSFMARIICIFNYIMSHCFYYATISAVIASQLVSDKYGATPAGTFAARLLVSVNLV